MLHKLAQDGEKCNSLPPLGDRLFGGHSSSGGQVDAAIRDLIPLHLVAQYHTVRCIIGCECGAAVLNTEYDEWLTAIVADTAAAGRSDTDHAALGDGEYIAIDLELAFSAQDEIKLLVIFVGVKEACLLPRGKTLERELSPRGIHTLASEHLARNLNLGRERQDVILELCHFAEIDSREIGGLCDCICFFHNFHFLRCLIGLRALPFACPYRTQSCGRKRPCARRHKRVRWLPASNYCDFIGHDKTGH